MPPHRSEAGHSYKPQQQEQREETQHEQKGHTVRLSDMSHGTLTVTEVEEFLSKPPSGFSVVFYGSGYCINSDPETNLVLIDDFNVCTRRIVFRNSLRR